MKGYKVFNPDWTCRKMQYEVGKTYEMDESPVLCERGFHFCTRVARCFDYYNFDPQNHVAEVEAMGCIVGDEANKMCTNKIRIVRELTWEEVLRLVNTGVFNAGKENTGNRNTGNRNTGNWNTGSWNTGNRNTGDCNTGSWNTGYGNTGNRNTGSWNTGYGNTGNRNTGNRNTGNRNTGNWNTGSWNTGNCNTGYGNTGNCNTGYGNTGDFNTTDNATGCFCTEKQMIMFFDKPSTWTLEDWRYSDAYRALFDHIDLTKWVSYEDMMDVEKAEHPESEATGGYLKKLDYKLACREGWAKMTDDEKQAVKNLPNFDAEKFEQITGIDVNE